MKNMEKPIHRSNLRLALGKKYYGFRRKLLWIRQNKYFAKTFNKTPLPYECFSHKTILMRKLKDVDMWMQENKVVNLKIATKKIDGILIRPGEIFSYWKLIGNPSKSKGYLDGMILKNGTFHSGTGGGLCQLSNLIFWIVAHSPLTIIERHRHGFDVFPDSNRTQPFGSGATCFYPHGDLMIQNNTNDTFQLFVEVGEEFLTGELRVSKEQNSRYEIVEKNHQFVGEFWGGHSRHNELFKQEFDKNNNLISEVLIVKNSAIMMYSPFLQTDENVVNL